MKLLHPLEGSGVGLANSFDIAAFTIRKLPENYQKATRN
jgi:hypothetical protein